MCVHEIAFPDLLKNYSKRQAAFTNTSLDSSRRMSKIKDCHYNKQVQKSSQHGHRIEREDVEVVMLMQLDCNDNRPSFGRPGHVIQNQPACRDTSYAVGFPKQNNPHQ